MNPQNLVSLPCHNVWRGLSSVCIEPSRPFGIMGILNLTPDSFFDGSKNMDLDAALDKAEMLRECGCDIFDLGPESSRPGSIPCGTDVEIERLAPVLEVLAAKYSPENISVDTWHSATAAYALENGAGIINDISACRWEPELLDVIAQYKPGYVLMHSGGKPENMQKKPEYENVVSEILSFFEKHLAIFAKAGIPEDRIVLDPGIGFGKLPAHNMEILRNLSRFLVFGRPLLLGISMKSFFRDFFSLPLEGRGCMTAAVSAFAWLKGVVWHRVHDPLVVGNTLEMAMQMN